MKMRYAFFYFLLWFTAICSLLDGENVALQVSEFTFQDEVFILESITQKFDSDGKQVVTSQVGVQMFRKFMSFKL